MFAVDLHLDEEGFPYVGTFDLDPDLIYWHEVLPNDFMRVRLSGAERTLVLKHDSLWKRYFK